MRIDKNRIRLVLPNSMEVFGDWVINNDDGTATIQLNTTKVAANQKIQVQYDGAPEPPLSKSINIKEIQYTVTVLDGVNQSVISTTKIDKGSSFARPTNPSHTGYTFQDFYMDANYATVAKFPIVVTGNVTIYAKFNINQYTVTIMDGATQVSQESLDYGTNWTPVQPDKEGFNKKGIYLDPEFNTVATLPIFVDEDKTVYLKYKDASIVRFFKDKYKLDSDLVGTFSIDNGSPMNVVDIPAGLTYPNLTWGGWKYGAEPGTDFTDAVVINAPTDVFGHWTPHAIHFDVTFDSNGGLYDGNKTELVVRGTTNTALVAPTDPAVLAGKDFIGYNLDKLEINAAHEPGTNVYEPNATPTDPNRRYYAIYKRTPGEVTINMMTNEQDKFKSVSGIEGESILLDGVPTRPGYDFREWAKNPEGDPPTYGPNENAIVWVMKLYDGANLISSIAYFDGDIVTPTEPKKDGKNFVGWFREPTFQTRMTPPFTINRSIDAFAKFADKTFVDITYKTADGKESWIDRVELGMPYGVTNCLPYFKDTNGNPIIIHKWRYMNGSTAEDYYPGQSFPHEIDGPIEFTAVPIAENIVKPEVGAIYLYSESDITDTNPSRIIYTYSEEGLPGINTIQQSAVDMIVEDYVSTTGKAAIFKGFKRVTYEQYSGPTSIYTIGDRLSQVGDTIGTFTEAVFDTLPQPTYVLMAVIEAGANSAYVTFDTAGGEPSTIADQIVAVGEKVAAPANPTKANARFKGWSTDGTSDHIVNLVDYVIPEGTSSLKLTAIWQNSYEITFDVNGGTPNILPIRAYEGELVTGVPTVTKEKFVFGGWMYGTDIIDISVWKVPIGGPAYTLVAQWNAIPPKEGVPGSGGWPTEAVLAPTEVTIELQKDGWEEYDYAYMTMSSDPDEGVTFTTEWDEANKKQKVIIHISEEAVVGDHTIEFRFANGETINKTISIIKTYTISVNIPEGVEITPFGDVIGPGVATESVIAGDNITTLIVSKKSGFGFMPIANWNISKNGLIVKSHPDDTYKNTLILEGVPTGDTTIDIVPPNKLTTCTVTGALEFFSYHPDSQKSIEDLEIISYIGGPIETVTLTLTDTNKYILGSDYSKSVVIEPANTHVLTVNVDDTSVTIGGTLNGDTTITLPEPLEKPSLSTSKMTKVQIGGTTYTPNGTETVCLVQRNITQMTFFYTGSFGGWNAQMALFGSHPIGGELQCNLTVNSDRIVMDLTNSLEVFTKYAGQKIRLYDYDGVATEFYLKIL